MELDAISAAIIGETSTMGGEGSVFGALIGARVGIMTFNDNRNVAYVISITHFSIL